MNKKIYETPNLALVPFKGNDVITASDGIGGGVIVTPEDEF